MSRTVLDAPVDSSPTTVDVNEGFAEFQAEQRAARNQSAPVEIPAEPVQDSDPEEPAGEKPAKQQEPLTDEQKSAAKRANNEKRWEKLLRERDEAKAELERLKTAKPAEPAAPATAKSKVVHPEDPEDPRPKQEDFTDFDEYVDARSSWNARQVIKAEQSKQSAAAAEKAQVETSTAFMDEVGEYAKTHKGFVGTDDEPGVLTIVGEELEDGLQVVSSSIMDHEKRIEIIDYLGNHPEAFDQILSHRGNPAKALIALGRIIAANFDDAPEAPPATTATPKPRLPKPPSPIRGQGHTPSGEAALDAAAEANDFTAFQKTLRARERKR